MVLRSHSCHEKSLFASGSEDGLGDSDKHSAADMSDDYGPPDEYGVRYPMEWMKSECRYPPNCFSNLSVLTTLNHHSCISNHGLDF
jgi:hypothetical protein